MKIESKEAVISVTKTHLGKVDRHEEKKIKIRPFVTDTATVGVKLSRSLPYGEVGLSVFVSVPCYLEELRDVYKEAKEIAEDLMTTGFEEILEWKEGQKK